MEIIKPFWTFYNMFDKMKSNDEKCPHILNRLEALQGLVVFVQTKEPDQITDDVKKALEKLTAILESAKELLNKFSKINMMVHMVKASDYKAEFENLSKSLTDAFVTLSGALHIYHEKKLDIQNDKLAEQEKKMQEQENKLAEQEHMLAEQESKWHEQEQKLAKQEQKLAKQEQKLAKQEDRLTGQEDLLQSLGAKIAYESRGYYCTVQ